MTTNLEIQRSIIKPVYAGRWMIVGRNNSGFLTVIYAIMGGGADSQNRNLVLSRNKLDFMVRVDPINPDAVTNPELVLYDAIRSVSFTDGTRGIVVSNGRQTESLALMKRPEEFVPTLDRWAHEPDTANTSRISAMIHIGYVTPMVSMSIIKARPDDATQSERLTFVSLSDRAGEGHFISTYRGEADKHGCIPAFEEDRPVVMPLMGEAPELAESYSGFLSHKYRVGLVAMTFNSDGTLHCSAFVNYGKPKS